jgi:hypothetical protein
MAFKTATSNASASKQPSTACASISKTICRLMSFFVQPTVCITPISLLLSIRLAAFTWNKMIETGGAVVGDKVSVEIDVEAVKKK